MRNLLNRSYLVLFILVFGPNQNPTHLYSQIVEVVEAAGRSTKAWSSFRNSGRSGVDEDVSLPIEWSFEQGIDWTVELPGYGQSCPVTTTDFVLITSVDGPEKDQNLLTCFSRDGGKIVWSLSEKNSLPGPSNYMFSRAAPTPMVDSDQAYAFYESGDLIAANLATGKIAWKRNLADETGTLKSRHGLGSSPTQSADMLFINLEHGGPSALIAINKRDGKTVWKTERPSGSSWSSPVLYKPGQEEQVIVSSQGAAAGFKASTGEKLWEISGLEGNTVPSPTIEGNKLYLGARQSEFGSIEKSAKSNLCLNLDALDAVPSVRWRSTRCVAHYASPVVCGDYVYLINKSGILGCLDKDTGKELYRQRLGFECWASPVANGEHLFIFGKNGTTVVLRAGDDFVKIAESQLWDLQNPPTPSKYKEYFPPQSASGSHGGGGGHGGTQGGNPNSKSQKSDRSLNPPTETQQSPTSRMVQSYLKSDTNLDGKLSGDEIPERLISAMENIDLNGDGILERNELTKMAGKFAARRRDSKNSSRDPIVYGVAADEQGILIRTGTRLYCIEGVD
ncbi:MAG: PQQ-binding-like beta-propeller repeat protein [Mariniblastus sp.]